LKHVFLSTDAEVEREEGGLNGEKEKEEDGAWDSLLKDLSLQSQARDTLDEENCSSLSFYDLSSELAAAAAAASAPTAAEKCVPTLASKLAWRVRSLACWLGYSHPKDVGVGEVSTPPPLHGGGVGWGDLPGYHAMPASPGMTSLVSSLVRKASTSNRLAVYLDSRVTSIDSRAEKGDGIRLKACGVGGEEISFTAKYAVIALPLPVLAAAAAAGEEGVGYATTTTSSSINFTPPLPRWKTRALLSGEITLSRYRKVFLSWTEPWWPTSWPAILALHNAPPFLLIENYLSLKGIPVLVGISMDPPPASGGEKFTLVLSLTRILAAIAAQERPPLGHPPPPSDALVSHWEDSKVTGSGCWASPATREGISPETLSALKAPIPAGGGLAGEAASGHSLAVLNQILGAQGGLFFAGEALHEEHMGSVHACLFSGEGVATDIARAEEGRAVKKK